MNIKMIAVDMDGTFLNDQKQYNTQRFKVLFDKMRSKNIKFVVASGNQYFQLRSFFPDLHQQITFVAENGANIILEGNPFYHAKLDYNTLISTLNVVKNLKPAALILCGLKSAYVSEDVGIKAFESIQFYYPKLKKIKELNDIHVEKDAIFKFALSFEEKEADKKLSLLRQHLNEVLTPVSSGHGDIDLIIPGRHKYHGLKLLSREWNIKNNEIATFGDSGNDLEMIKYTLHSFAMRNGQEEVKQAASCIIGTNNSETVLDTIQHIVE